jgi:hypothetical protein
LKYKRQLQNNLPLKKSVALKTYTAGERLLKPLKRCCIGSLFFRKSNTAKQRCYGGQSVVFDSTMIGKVNGKVCPRTGQEGPERE